MTRKSFFFSMTFVGGVVALMACGGDEASERYPNADAFCEAKAEEECNAVALQCGATVDACVTGRKGACTQLAAAASGQNRTYRASQAESCITKTKELFSSRTIDPTKEEAQNEACNRVFEGSIDKSQPCELDFQCKGSMVCDKGVCAAEVERKEGEGCNNAGETCAKGTYCKLEGQLRYCRPRLTTDALCSDTDLCKEDLRCAGTCKPKFGVGQPCASTEECVAGTSCTLQGSARTCIASTFPQGTTCADYDG